MIDAQELAGIMATWLASNEHTRPFWQDRSFVREFGRTTRAQLTAAIDELWRRADFAAHAARVSIALPARLGGKPYPEHDDQGT